MSHDNKTEIRVPSYEDLVERVQKFESFQIAERIYSAELIIPQLVINAKDLIAEAVATGVSEREREAARARRWNAQVEAAYRGWRDRTWLDLKQDPIGETDKGTPKYPTDSHVEKLLHMHPEYGSWRSRLDYSQEAAECAEAIYEAHRLKARLIENAERLLRDEAGGPYRISEDERQSVVRQPQLPS